MFKNLAEVDNIVKNGNIEDLDKLIADWREYKAANYKEEEEYEEEEEEEYEEEEDWIDDWKDNEDYMRCISLYGDDRTPVPVDY